MVKQKRIADYGIVIGKLPKGKLNKITDVKGVRVGHCTIDTKVNKTGVTVVLPRPNGIFFHKMIAACYVLNGFGKTAGLMQIEEVGVLESPIALTNTLNIGLVHDALVEYAIGEGKKKNYRIESVNPIVCECSDAYLNDVQNRAVKKHHVFKAIKESCVDFAEGDVGGGKGLTCHQLKGGIGSSSRLVELDGKKYTVGVLVQSNYGWLEDLMINGEPVGQKIAASINAKKTVEKGSIIVIIATDIPCSSRQLRRLCKRAGVGLVRVGSYVGHRSGDIMIGFTTANTVNHEEKKEIVPMRIVNEMKMDKVFRAVAEATEEAVLNSMVTAGRVKGYSGNVRESLQDYI